MEIKFRSDSEVTLEDFMGGDDRVCLSAWVSLGNDDSKRLQNRKRVEGLINFLYKNQHMTPFESSVFTFRIKTPLFVAREYHRHRTQSINEWSGRYSEMLPEFYTPTRERPLVQTGKPGAYVFEQGNDDQYAYVLTGLEKNAESAWATYQRLLEHDIAKEVARDVLPLNTYTYFYSTMNARNLIHFLNLRTAPDALYEIRDVACQMEYYLKQQMPLTYNAWNSNGI